MALQADYRAAAVGMLRACADAASISMNTYPGRPVSLTPPHGFIDAMSDVTAPMPGTSTLYQHTPRIEVVLVWGLFDSKEAVTQRDEFVDAYHAWVRARPHESGAATLIGPAELSDLPAFNPDWGNENQRATTYFATRIVLEGFATD